MALITCKDCENEFSTDAKYCPHCGALKPRNKTKSKLFWVAVIVMAVYLAKPLSPEEQAAYDKHNLTIAADVACELSIKESANDPNSIEFDHMSYSVLEVKPNIYLVTAPFRARNGFNALIKSTVQCLVQHNGGDNWKTIRMSIS